METILRWREARVALARAIYKKAEVIFLDEFTSNLDLETERKIMTKIRNNLPNTTIIMITHRLATAIEWYRH